MNSLARVWLGALLVVASGCRASDAPARTSPPATTLRIGLGDVGAADAQFGVRQVVGNQSVEPLVKYDEEGRPTPFLIDKWILSSDGLKLTIFLRAVSFHDGSPLTATDVRQSLARSLPQVFGPLYDDFQAIDVVSDRELSITFKRRTAFALDALDVQITKANAPSIGTGPFSRSADAQNVELLANDNYHLGRPSVRSIVLKSYPSVRAAWADLLRGQVDMLYEVGVDAIDSLEPSSQVQIYSYRRHYATLAIFNSRRPVLRSAALRRSMSSAIDRLGLVADVFGGAGRAATGPVWPDHWANDAPPSASEYAPERVAPAKEHLRLRCVFPRALSERLALLVQRQLQSIGVDLELEALPLDELAQRLKSADYDMLLTEAIAGPSLIRPYLFWHSKGPYNYGGFSSPEVDAALDRIRHAENDAAYRAGVSAFQEAVAHDPPAIFLAWNERARAVSTAFDVPAEPGRDILSSIHLWRPARRPPAQALN